MVDLWNTEPTFIDIDAFCNNITNEIFKNKLTGLKFHLISAV